jgi:predicted amidohydrolase
MTRIACLQTRPMATFDAAIAEAEALARQALDGGAQMLCLPEYCGGLASKDGAMAPPAAAEEEHPVLAALQSLAKEAGVWVHVG